MLLVPSDPLQSPPIPQEAEDKAESFEGKEYLVPLWCVVRGQTLTYVHVRLHAATRVQAAVRGRQERQQLAADGRYPPPKPPPPLPEDAGEEEAEADEKRREAIAAAISYLSRRGLFLTAEALERRQLEEPSAATAEGSTLRESSTALATRTGGDPIAVYALRCPDAVRGRILLQGAKAAPLPPRPSACDTYRVSRLQLKLPPSKTSHAGEVFVLEAREAAEAHAWEVAIRRASATRRPSVEEEAAAWSKRPLPGSLASLDESIWYRVGVVNVGESGIEYHGPTSADQPSKIKQRSTLGLPSVRALRLRDEGFWAMAYGRLGHASRQDDKQPAMFYETLLPWLAEEPLASAASRTASDPSCPWRTPQYGDSSAYRSLLEACRYCRCS